jgi:UDP-N-acetylglucosamine 2-epimerase (non-hydrolysing)
MMELKRVVRKWLPDLLFPFSEFASQNLRKEGVPEEKIRLVGNIMIDTLEADRERAEALEVESILRAYCLEQERQESKIDEGEWAEFTVITMHRPSNVDKMDVVGPIIEFLVREVGTDQSLIWPISKPAEGVRPVGKSPVSPELRRAESRGPTWRCSS